MKLTTAVRATRRGLLQIQPPLNHLIQVGAPSLVVAAPTMPEQPRVFQRPCATCREKMVDYSARHFPFCSIQCREQDLDSWMVEKYKIKGASAEDNEAEYASEEDG